MPTTRPRLGLYLYAPRIGGAERYAKDLLHGIDRERFEVVFLLAAWPALEAFMDLEGVEVETRRMSIAEPGAQLAPTAPKDAATSASVGYGEEITPSRLRRAVTRMPGWPKYSRHARDALRPVAFLQNVRLLEGQVRDARLDILHIVNGGYPGAISAQALAVAARRAGVGAAMMTVCSTAVPRAVPAIERIIDDRVDKALNAIIVPGAWPGRALVERRGFDGDKLVSIPWGVHTSRSIGEERLPGRVVVGTLANFTGAKGHGVLLEAFARVARDHPEAELILAGDGPVRREVQAQADRIGLGGRVRFPGNVADALAFCQGLDIFVLASDIEGLPYVVLEAMSQGRPVIATNVGAMAEAVDDGVTGMLVPPRDVDHLAVALQTMLSDDARRAAMAAASRRQFEGRFSLTRMLAAHEDQYERLLSRQR